jgi:phage terminase large subunit GpA-like protein
VEAVKKEHKIKLKTLELFRDIAKIMAPPPDLTVSQWADKYRVLSPESSSESGRWNTDRAPYQREIMDAASDPEVDTVVIMSSAQVGKTEIINNIIGYHIDYDPCPMLLVMPTDTLAKTWSKKRLSPMIRDTPALHDKIKDAKSRDSDNTILEKGFPGGYIAIVGANSPVGLSSRPIRIVLADEVDRFPPSAGKEGDPLSLAVKRTATYWNKKKIFVSTPTEVGISRIEKEFSTSSQEEWNLPCPLCGKYQPIDWDRIKFQKIDEKGTDVTDVTMECKFCKENFNEFEWKEMSSQGKWIPKKEGVKDKRGFHLNAFVSPWERWEEIIKNFLEAKRNGKETLKTWVNTYLGQPWEDDEGETLEHEVLIKRREAYNCQVPDGVLVLTAGVDVQDDRIEIEVVGWGKDKESWGIEYKKIYGNLEQPEIWKELDEYLSSSFYFNDGSIINISCTCIDTGGHYTNETYKFIKPREIRRIFGIKGYAGFDKPVIGKPSKNNREKINLFPIGVDILKDRVYARLKEDFEGPGYSHFPIESEKGYDEEYFKSLCSEKKVTKYSKGVASFRWVKKRKRNEGLDLRNYATAALEILNPKFEILEKMKKNGMLNNQNKKTSNVKKRRVISKGVQ